MRFCRLALVLFVLGFVSLEARAGDLSKNPQANAHISAGLAAFDAKDYATASREFDAAYKLDPIPALLWSWAQAERFGGNCGKALELYRKYIYADITPSQTQATREMIKLCEAQQPLPPPPHTEPPPAPEEEGSPAWYKDPLGGALTVSGVIGIGLGIGFLSAASNSRDRADNAMFLDDFHAALDEATTRRRIGAISLTLGVALVATGVTVYVIRNRKNQQVIAGTDGRTVFVGARF